jgi:hypothetical protein
VLYLTLLPVCSDTSVVRLPLHSVRLCSAPLPHLLVPAPNAHRLLLCCSPPCLAHTLATTTCRSVTAAQSFPAAPLVLSACMYGPSASPRLLRLGAEWAAWMFKHAPAHQLRAMAGPLLQRLLAALGLQQGAGGDDGDGDAMQVRECRRA